MLLILLLFTANAQEVSADEMVDGPCQMYEVVELDEEPDADHESGQTTWDGSCYLNEVDFRLYLDLPLLDRWFPEHHLTIPLPERWNGDFRLSDWMTLLWSPARHYWSSSLPAE